MQILYIYAHWFTVKYHFLTNFDIWYLYVFFVLTLASLDCLLCCNDTLPFWEPIKCYLIFNTNMCLNMGYTLYTVCVCSLATHTHCSVILFLSVCFWLTVKWLIIYSKYKQPQSGTLTVPQWVLYHLLCKLSFVLLAPRFFAPPMGRRLGVKNRLQVTAAPSPKLESFYTQRSRQPTQVGLKRPQRCSSARFVAHCYWIQR